MDSKILIAKITSAHGIKGLVKISSFTENPKDFAKYSGKIFDAKNKNHKIKIISNVPNKEGNLFIVQVDGISDRNAAEALRNTELFINRSDLKKNKSNEFYQVDLVGLKVLNLKKEKIGIIEEVNDFGAGIVVDVKFDDEEYSKNNLTNFSFTNEIFPEVDVENGFVVLDIPEIVEIKSSQEKSDEN